MYLEKLHRCYSNIMLRCGVWKGGNKRNVSDYAKRGVKVCAEWHEYKAFKEWALSHGWREGLVIDRIDNDGDYEPSNCRFVTQAENLLNRRNTVSIVYKGKRVKLHDLWKSSGCPVTYKVFMCRYHLGWDIDKALTTPLLKQVDNLKWRNQK